MALSVSRPVDGVAAAQRSIRKAVEFLLRERDSEPLPSPDSGAWYRTCWVHEKKHRVTDIIRTAVIIGALINAGESSDTPAVASAVDWLVKRQNTGANDSGWAYQRGGESRVLPTCFALLALIAASTTTDKNRWKNPIENGLKHLTERFRNTDGSFGSGILTAAHTIYACLVLQAARAGQFSFVASAENDAIKWLLSNQDDALSPVEEKIEVDPTGAADYPFMFTMEALLLRVLGNSQDGSQRETRLWLDVQRSMRADFDENTGGFYGRRVFSWSTANGLYAIKASEHNLKAIPSRPQEDPSGFKVGTAILLLVIVLVAAVVYLTAVAKFALLQASFFSVLVLACLLAYGRIGEVTFQQLVSSIFRVAEKGR